MTRFLAAPLVASLRIIKYKIFTEANNNRLLTEREGHTATAEGQYFPVWLGLFIIWHSVSDSKMHFYKIKLAWGIFVHLFNFGKISIFLPFSGSFEFAGFSPKQTYTAWIVSMETVRSAKS